MRAYPECIPCFINQGLNAVKKLKLPKEKELEIAKRCLKLLSQFENFDQSPAYYAYFIQQIVKEIAQTEDPFREMKKLANQTALRMLEEVRKDYEKAPDKLAFSLKLSAIGNYIDFAVKGVFDVEREVKGILNSEFTIFDYEIFKEKLKNANSVLIIGDNAGEIVFDKLLVETLKDLGKEVIYG